MCRFCLVGGVFITCTVCGHIEPMQFFFAESSTHLIDLRTCQDGPGFPPSSYQNQKFVYKKTVSAKDNLKRCILTEGGKPGNESSMKL